MLSLKDVASVCLYGGVIPVRSASALVFASHRG